MKNAPIRNLFSLLGWITLLVVLVELYVVAVQLNFEFRATSAVGHVVGLIPGIKGGSEAKVDFVDCYGQRHTFINPHNGFERGDVQVLYFPGTDHAEIKNAHRWDTVCLFLIVPLFLSGVLLFLRRQMKKLAGLIP